MGMITRGRKARNADDKPLLIMKLVDSEAMQQTSVLSVRQ